MLRWSGIPDKDTKRFQRLEMEKSKMEDLCFYIIYDTEIKGTLGNYATTADNLWHEKPKIPFKSFDI